MYLSPARLRLVVHVIARLCYCIVRTCMCVSIFVLFCDDKVPQLLLVLVNPMYCIVLKVKPLADPLCVFQGEKKNMSGESEAVER